MKSFISINAIAINTVESFIRLDQVEKYQELENIFWNVTFKRIKEIKENKGKNEKEENA